MQPVNVKVKLREFDIKVQNESSPDEPYLWVVYFKMDGTTLDINRPVDSSFTVYSPSGRHGNLGPDSYDEESSEEPLIIPTAIGEWNTSLDAVALFPQVIPACAVAALVMA